MGTVVSTELTIAFADTAETANGAEVKTNAKKMERQRGTSL